MIREFGREILDGDGRIDRRRLGALAFASPELLGKLNAIVRLGSASAGGIPGASRCACRQSAQGMIVYEAAES